jgi:electron transfer flavoprotein beta subunit
MKILVCITHVPDTTSKISFTESDTKFNSAGVSYIIGPYDDYALARAIELKEAGGGDVHVLNVGTAETEPSLRKALAIGADEAFRIDVEPTDSYQVAEQIASFAKDKAYDLILMGRESIDFNSGSVHGMVAALLNISFVSPIMKLDVNAGMASVYKEIEGGKESIDIALPLVAGCQEPIAEWKIPSMRGIMSARTKPLSVLPANAVEPKTKVHKFEMPAEKTACQLFDPADVDGLVNTLVKVAKVIN